VADPRSGQQLENGVKHPKPSPEHRHHHDVVPDNSSFSRPERCLHGVGHRGHLPKGLGREQNTDAVGRTTKGRRGRANVPELHQGVVNERMIDDA
jgi:hypothetical protein